MSRTTPSHTGRQRNAISLPLLFLQNPSENPSCLLNTGCHFSWQGSACHTTTASAAIHQLSCWQYTSPVSALCLSQPAITSAQGQQPAARAELMGFTSAWGRLGTSVPWDPTAHGPRILSLLVPGSSQELSQLGTEGGVRAMPDCC